MRWATLGPVMLAYRKLDIPCMFDISHKLSSLLFIVNCIKELAEVLQHIAVAMWGFGGLSPPKQSSNPPN